MRYHKKHSFLTAKTGYTAQPPYTLPFTEPCFYYLFFRNSSIPLAAALPAPIARITVAAPVTASPPAYTPSLLVLPVSSSAMIHFLLFVSRPMVVEEISGFGERYLHRSRTQIPESLPDVFFRMHPARQAPSSPDGYLLPSRSRRRESPSGWSEGQK